MYYFLSVTFKLKEQITHIHKNAAGFETNLLEIPGANVRSDTDE